jgi:hypothetical protein
VAVDKLSCTCLVFHYRELIVDDHVNPFSMVPKVKMLNKSKLSTFRGFKYNINDNFCISKDKKRNERSQKCRRSLARRTFVHL